jgi:hypothetical protein
MLNVGDRPRLTYTLRGPDGALVDATVAVAVTRPDGTAVTPPSVIHDGLGQYHADVTVDVDGVWRWTWTASGAAVDAEEGAVYVAAPGSAVPWAPTLAQVAAYVPKRTRPVGDTSDDPLGTFTAATRPTDAIVYSLIADAVRWVLARTGVPATNRAAADAATVAAAIRAAGMVELGYPGEDPDTNTADILLDQANKALADVQAAADTDPNPASQLMPTWSFPDPPKWADVNL